MSVSNCRYKKSGCLLLSSLHPQLQYVQYSYFHCTLHFYCTVYFSPSLTLNTPD